jgi:hypothetical protein
MMGRFSRLRLEVRQLLHWPLPLINTQKGRIDCLLAYRKNPELRPHTAVLPKHYARSDILHLVVQQEVLHWPVKKPPTFLFMDSYAELTDQSFVHHRQI